MNKLTLALSVLLTSSSVFATDTVTDSTEKVAVESGVVVTETTAVSTTTTVTENTTTTPAVATPKEETTTHAAPVVDNNKPMVGDAAAGKTKSATCAACHGVDGNSLIPTFPKLAGQHTAYIFNQLKLFKSGVRVDPTMKPMVANLSEQDMHDLAAYFSGQTLKLAPASDNKLGKRIFHGGDIDKGVMACAACHGVKGAGNPAASYPQIQGQQSMYTVKQLKAFADGTRTGSASTHVMQDITSKMSDTEMQAVATYIGGLGH